MSNLGPVIAGAVGIAAGLTLLALFMIWRPFFRRPPRKVITSITVPIRKGALVETGDLIDVTVNGVSGRYMVLSKTHDITAEKTTLGLWCETQDLKRDRHA